MTSIDTASRVVGRLSLALRAACDCSAIASLHWAAQAMVGETGFEPATLCSQSRCATRLRYSPDRWCGRAFAGRDRPLAALYGETNQPALLVVLLSSLPLVVSTFTELFCSLSPVFFTSLPISLATS